ncbi:MAG: AAA family ATPase [Desulfurococcales archaeon]|nr:AAA family ATPase [Desulfurococcales archaeon]
MEGGGRLLVVVGMPASGKSTAARILGELLGCPVVSMGDAVRRETARRGLPLTPENVERVAASLRASMGRAAVALLVAEEAARLMGGSGCVIVEGARSPEELPVLARLGRVCLVAVHASPRRRLERLSSRGRPGESGWDALRLRDRANLEFGVGELIALADFMVVNEWGLEELRGQLRRVAEELRHGAWEGCSGGGGPPDRVA